MDLDEIAYEISECNQTKTISLISTYTTYLAIVTIACNVITVVIIIITKTPLSTIANRHIRIRSHKIKKRIIDRVSLIRCFVGIAELA